MNWEGCPPNLTEFSLHNNKITKLNWEGCLTNLDTIWLSNNQITELNWEGCPWNLEFPFNVELTNKFIEYKKSRNNIPHLPYQCMTNEHKAFINDLTHTFLLPPKDNEIGFDSPYYKYELYKNGGISYKEVVKEFNNITT
jgi:Leucine-rich repeat (LRR) protein